MSNKYILITNARAKFVSNVFTPSATTGKYSIQLLIDKNDPQVAALQAEIDAQMKNDFPGVTRNLKSPLRDGDVDRDTALYPEYTNSVFLEPSTKFPPQVLNRDHSPITDGMNILKNGSVVNATINFYPFDYAGNKGLGVGLGAVQFWEDGAPFTSGASSIAFPMASAQSEFEKKLDACML